MKQNTMNAEINSTFEKHDIKITSEQTKKFEQFLKIFMEKNSQINLSAIRDSEWIMEKHFLDSLVLNKYVKLKWKVLDLGTGWWFPGIPLKIIDENNAEFTLLDSVGKKITAVNEFVEDLKLKNINWIQWRAEEMWQDKKYRNTYDYIVSRSVAYFPNLLEYAIPLLKVWWTFISYKLDNYEEIEAWEEAMKTLWCMVENVERYEIWWQERILLFIKKTRNTPKQYPRKNNLIKW